MTLTDEIRAFFESRGVRVQSVRRLAGGASQEVWLIDLFSTEGDGESVDERQVILRRDTGGALSALARTRREEYAIMAVAEAFGVPVPRVLYEPVVLGGSDAFFMEYLPGETIGRRLVRDPAFASAREVLPEQVAQALARIHTIDPAQLPFLGPSYTALDLVAALEGDLDACGEGHPAFELGLRWLRLNAPVPERIGVVHGDFRMGNFIVGPDGLRGVLDWELTHIGDLDEDLGWFCVRAWRFGADQLAAGGITTREQLLQLYAAAGGGTVTEERLHYWELFGTVKWGIIALSQAARHLHGDTQSLELASLGRLAAELEWDTLQLLSAVGVEA